MKLVIVESPTKAKTISRFLGKEYRVESSYGHVRDLPKSKIGIEVKRNFAPSYVVPPKAKELVAKLKTDAKKASLIILATDEDREGEAIAWHLVQALELGEEKDINNGESDSRIRRIVFHEITKPAIQEALAHPRGIDVNLVDAQQARRVLDRLVGYELSPFLWRKVRYGLSAGRVQSVAVRLVVEREREIQKFKKDEYWTIEAIFSKSSADQTFSAKLFAVEGKPLGKMGIPAKASAEKPLPDLKKARYRISQVTVKEKRRTPPPPFTTSTLQQEAARKFGFSAKQTMVIAQQLYEKGHITYMRTDSVHLAQSALLHAQRVIGEYFGKEYQLPAPRFYKTGAKGAQEAHEAIRPTDFSKKIGDSLKLSDRGQQRLYGLIWKRAVASQMQEAIVEQTSVDIATEDDRYLFRASGQVIRFDGFIRIYTEGRDENGENETEGILPPLSQGERVALTELTPLQHFTEPPPQYTDATLIKALETAGIGRPSTYAPTLSTIQEREYVEKIQKKYHPTEIGILVNDILVEHFPEIIDIGFTSHIEEELDSIAEGKMKWTEVCKEFYGPFKKNLSEKEESVKKQVEISEVPCPHCGKMMLMKFGRMGKFLACPDPESKVTLPMPEEAAKIKELSEKTRDERCPLCGEPMEVKRGRFGFFLGCADYPKCKGVSRIWNKTGFRCPHCKQGDVVEKKSRGRGKLFYACTRYPDCTFVMNKKPETQEELAAALKHWKENPPKKKKAAVHSKTVE